MNDDEERLSDNTFITLALFLLASAVVLAFAGLAVLP